MKFRENCNTEASGGKCKCSKENYLDFDIFYKVDCLENINPLLEWKLRKFFKLEAKLNRLRIYSHNMRMAHPQNNHSTRGLLTFWTR